MMNKGITLNFKKILLSLFIVFGNRLTLLDCVQSAFSLKILLVLIFASAIANHDVIQKLMNEAEYLIAGAPNENIVQNH